MRIAVPIWEDKISPVLDTAAKLLILERLDQENVSRTEAFLYEQEITKRCFCIQKLGIDILICGAVSRPFAERLTAKGVNVIQGISGAVDEIVAAYLDGTLNQSKYLMPGSSQRPENAKVSKRTRGAIDRQEESRSDYQRCQR